MVAPDDMFQAEVRLKQAKVSDRAWGGLGVILSGDFMQLPPVDPGSVAPSLAQDPNLLHAPDDPDSNDVDKKRGKFAETVQGLELWRRTRRVVSLDLNRRSPGSLSRLLQEMRELGRSRKALSDYAWGLYESRYMKPNDPRTQEAPFSDHPWQYIVHRHKIRVYRSLVNAQHAAASLKRPLYVVKASDVAVELCNQWKMPSVQRYLDALCNPRDTADLPGVLPLYVGMRLTMHSKECVRYGLMKGCVCTLRHIVFSDHEELPESSAMVYLKYLPVCLWLQADDVEWRLPEKCLPSDLPHDTVRTGLFPLGLAEGYIQAKPDKNDKDSWFKVRRRTFKVLPSDTLIVYGAQGCSYEAVIADMQRPPRMDPVVHWLACYVMLSRPRTLEGLLVLRPASRAELERAPPDYLLKELDRLAEREDGSFTELLERLEAMTLKYRTDLINQTVLHPEGPGRQLEAVAAARKPRKRLLAKTPGAAVDTRPSAKSARLDSRAGNSDDRGDVGPPAKAARIDSLRSAPAAEANGSAAPPSGASARTDAPERPDMPARSRSPAERRVSNVSGTQPPAKSARTDSQGSVPDEPGHFEPPAMNIRIDSARATVRPAASSSAAPPRTPGSSSSSAGPEQGYVSTQAAAAAEARRQADWARGVGADAAARLEQQTRERPSSSQRGSEHDAADLFGAAQAASLRAALKASRASAATPPEPATTTATGASRTGPETPSQMEPDSAMTPPPGHMTSAAPPSPAAAVPESSAPPPRKCSRWRHICAEHPILGCSSCDRRCHRDNSDPLCDFYGRAREDHADAALGDTVDHISQTQFVLSIDGVKLPDGPKRDPGWYEGHKLVVTVDDMRFELGTASGDGCNCLIDTLRQLLNALGSVVIPPSCVAEVRGLLEDRHSHGSTPITSRDYLDLALYWEDVVNLLWEQDHLRQQFTRSADFFEIICVDLMWVGHGERLPHHVDRSTRRGLYVARVNGNHFVPLRRFQDDRCVRPVPRAQAGHGDPTTVAQSVAAL